MESIHKRMVQFQKLKKTCFSPHTGTNVSSGNCLSFSCGTSSFLLILTVGPRDQFPRWRHSRTRLSVCSVLRCPDLCLQCSVSFVHGLKAPHENNVTRWYRQFVETGCLCKGRSPGRPRVSDDNNKRVRVAFQ
jgi:hypothetical protein